MGIGRRIRRLLVVTALVPLASGVAFASTVVLQGSKVSAGDGSVAACDHTPAWQYSFLKNGIGQVSSVTVSNIAPQCVGGQMQLTLSGSMSPSLGSATVIPACAMTCSVTITIPSGLLYPSEISTVHALIVGPS